MRQEAFEYPLEQTAIDVEELHVEVRYEFVRAGHNDPIACPICSSEPSGVSQVFVAPATVIVENGSVGYDGQGTDMQILWNNSEIVLAGNLPLLVCPNGHHFVHPNVVAIKG